MTKLSIWLPKSETTVTVSDSDVRVTEEMTMQLRPIAKTGFKAK